MIRPLGSGSAQRSGTSLTRRSRKERKGIPQRPQMSSASPTCASVQASVAMVLQANFFLDDMDDLPAHSRAHDTKERPLFTPQTFPRVFPGCLDRLIPHGYKGNYQ